MKQKNYQADEFIINAAPDPIEVCIDKKVSLLYDLCILKQTKVFRDSREEAVRKVLSQYTTEDALNNALHDIVRGDKPLNTFLAQKCYNENNKGVM